MEELASDLPAVVLEEVMKQTEVVAEGVISSLRETKVQCSECREQLVNQGLLAEETSIASDVLPPTACATDGAYAFERLMSISLVCATAVVVEGLTPPKEKGLWNQPRHHTIIQPEPHHHDTELMLRALMIGEELRLMKQAPHELVIFDGTLLTPLIHFRQALSNLPNSRNQLECTRIFLDRCMEYFETYLTVLSSSTDAQQYVGLPKYSSSYELSGKMGWSFATNERQMMSLILQENEMTAMVTRHFKDELREVNTEHLALPEREAAIDLFDEIIDALSKVQVFYFRPHQYKPPLRVEIPHSIAANKDRLASVVKGLHHQTVYGNMIEPYPIYMADRYAKALPRALRASLEATASKVTEGYEGDMSEVFMSLRSYRS